MKASGAHEQGPAQGLDIGQLMTLADGSLLKELGAATTGVTDVLERAIRVAHAMQSGNRAELVGALQEAVAAEELPDLEDLGQFLGAEIPLSQPHEIGRLALGTSIPLVGDLQNYINVSKTEIDQLPVRQQSCQTAFGIARSLADMVNNAEPAKKARLHDYMEEYTKGFMRRTRDPAFEFLTVYQFPFIEVAPGQELTIRHMLNNLDRKGVELGEHFALVVKVDDIDIENLSDGDLLDSLPHGLAYATIPPHSDSTIRYANEAITADSRRAETADQEVIEKLEVVTKALGEQIEQW